MELTQSEKNSLNSILIKINNLKMYLDNNIFHCSSDNLKNWYNYLNEIKNIIGNFNDTLSFISCLMTKEYLLKEHSIRDFDVALKSQSAPRLDIDIYTINGKRIIAEIKTIKSISDTDLGSQQKTSIFNDIKKLKNTDSDYKYLFLTEINTYNIIRNKYKSEIIDIELVLLE